MKAQGLPLTTIVIAALVLAVLIVVLFMFGKQSGAFGKLIGDCENKDGKCVADAVACNDKGGRVIDFKCTTSTNVCCLGA